MAELQECQFFDRQFPGGKKIDFDIFSSYKILFIHIFLYIDHTLQIINTLKYLN